MSQVVQANIEVHTRMADRYNRLEPHFRPENRAKVRGILMGLCSQCGSERLLDIGCGTGFIIDLAKDLFDEVHGVDVTQAMLDKVDLSSGNVTLHNAPAEKLPFSDCMFDLVSAYSFLHHTEDYRTVLREASRVLKPGGICYADLEPNRLFWAHLSALPSDDSSLSATVIKARDSVTQVDTKVEKDFGIPKKVFNQAEYGKTVLGGLDPLEIHAILPSLGFKTCTARYEWFLGQAEIMHQQSFEDAAKIDAYLRNIAPLSNHLFKYLQLVFVK